MRTIGCDLRARQQTLAMLDTMTREVVNRTLMHEGNDVGIKEVQDDIWLVSSIDYDLGYFDLETRVLEPLQNPFEPKVLLM